MVRVATLNLRSNANRWNERFPFVIDTLLRVNADVIALQEIRIKIEQHNIIADALSQKSGQEYQAFLCEDWYDPHILANAFLTRIPVIEHERIELPEGFRTAQRILIEVNGQNVNVVNTHLHHKPYKDESIRLEQMGYILNWMDARGRPFMLMGDMNARPDSETVKLAKNGLQSAYEVIHGSEPDATFPTPLRAEENMTSRTIDYIFCEAQFKVKDCQLIGTRPASNDEMLYCSDHFGLMAEII